MTTQVKPELKEEIFKFKSNGENIRQDPMRQIEFGEKFALLGVGYRSATKGFMGHHQNF